MRLFVVDEKERNRKEEPWQYLQNKQRPEFGIKQYPNSQHEKDGIPGSAGIRP